MANKMTKKDYFQILRDAYPADADNHDEVIAFIDHELDLLARKNTSEKKPTKQQIANDVLRNAILDAMVEDTKYTVTDMTKQFECCADLTNQRVSALLRPLIKEGKVERTEEKRVAYFSKVA